MSQLHWKKLALAAVLAGGAQFAASCGASALTLPPTPGDTAQVAHQDGNIIRVDKKKKRRHYHNWDEYHHHHGGRRYRYKRPGYGYYYHGYYYATPWWTLWYPVPLVPVVPAPGITIQIQ